MEPEPEPELEADPADPAEPRHHRLRLQVVVPAGSGSGLGPSSSSSSNSGDGTALPEGVPARRQKKALSMSSVAQHSEREATPKLQPQSSSTQDAASSPLGASLASRVGSPRTLQRWTSEIGTAGVVEPTPATCDAPSKGTDDTGWVEMYQLRSSLDKRIVRLKVVAADSTAPELGDQSSVATEPGAALPAAAGRYFAPQHAPLPAGFYIELFAAVHGVSLDEAQHFLSASRNTFVQATCAEVIHLKCADDTDGSQVRGLLERLDAARLHFPSNRALLQALDSTVTHTATEKFQEIEEVLIVHTNVAEQLAEFERRSALHTKLAAGSTPFVTPKGANSAPWDRLGNPATSSGNTVRFAIHWCRRLQALSTDYYRKTSLRHALVLPSLSNQLVSAVMTLVRLTCTLLYSDQLRLGNAGGDHISQRKLDDLVNLVKEVLSSNTCGDADQWRAHLTKAQVVEYNRDLETVYKEYFVLLRSVGWHLRPELRIAAWIVQSPGLSITTRLHCLKSEWHFIVQLLPQIRRFLPNAARHLVMGMMDLSQLLLKDDSIFASVSQKRTDRRKTVATAFSEVVASSVRSCSRLLLGDLEFVRQVCESLVLVAAHYEAANTMDLLTQLRRCGYRALRLNPLPVATGSVNIMGTGGMLSFPIPKLLHWHEAEHEPKLQPEPEPDLPRLATSRRGAFATSDDPRVVIVPPRIADDDVDAFVQQLYDDRAQGFVVVLPGNLGRHAWQTLEHISSELLSAQSQQVICELDLRPGCMCLVAGSAQQLLRSRLHFEADMNPETMGVGAVSVVACAEAAFKEAKAVQESLNGLTLQIARSLLEHAGCVEYTVQKDEDKMWMVTLSYLKALSALNLTRIDSDNLSRVCRTAMERFDAFEKRKQMVPLSMDSAAQGLGRTSTSTGVPAIDRSVTTGGGLDRASASIDAGDLVSSGLARASTSVDDADTSGITSGESSSVETDARRARRRTSLDSHLANVPAITDAFLSGLGAVDSRQILLQEDSPPASPEAKGQLVSNRFASTRSELTMTQAAVLGQQLLETVQHAVAEGKTDLATKLTDDYTAANSGRYVDPLVVREAKQLILREIGHPSSHRAVRTNSLQKPAGGFADRYLKDGQVTILYTSSTYSNEIVLQNCEAVRVKLEMLGHVRVEYDLSLSNHAAVVQALKSYLASPDELGETTYDLPIVFFGTEMVGGWSEVHQISDKDLLSFRQRYEEESQTWLEMKWEEIFFFGEPLGKGGQGTVSRARLKGNDYAVKVFNSHHTADFKEEVKMLERLRHPNVVTFYGAVTQNAEHLAIVMELCLGSVFDYLRRWGRATLDDKPVARLGLAVRLRYAHDAAKGVSFLHTRGVIHRDLKTSNMLISNNAHRTVKICDFAVSRKVHPSLEVKGTCTKASVLGSSDSAGDDSPEAGTPGWISPEEILGKNVTIKSDVYSFAMILWELLNATTPFHEYLHGPGVTPALARVRCIEIGQSDLRPDLPTPADRAAFFGTREENISLILSLIQDCWKRVPEDRPDFDTICKSLVRIYKFVEPQKSKAERTSDASKAKAERTGSTSTNAMQYGSSSAQAAAASTSPRIVATRREGHSTGANPFSSPRLPTADEVGLITTSWAKVSSTVGLQDAGILFFNKLFGAHPEALTLFSSFRDIPNYESSDPFRGHAIHVFFTIEKAIQMLGNLEQLVPLLERMGKRHVVYGAQVVHYEWVGEALLDTLHAALGEEFLSEVREAYRCAYALIAATMIGEKYLPSAELKTAGGA